MPVTRRRWLLAKLAPHITRLGGKRLFGDVRTFCLFVGHGRSGGTLVGALLNAHPNVVLTNELDALAYVERGLSQDELFNLIYYVDRRLVRKGSTGGGGYTYAVPHQWQGRHREVIVIGDRKAGATATHIAENPATLDRLRETVRTDIRFINVVRNPYDNITTTFRRSRLTQLPPEERLRAQIDFYFERCEAVRRVGEHFGAEQVKRVHHEDVVNRTEETLTELCRFFGLEIPDGYLRDCKSIIQASPHVTRTSIDWTPELVKLVAENMTGYPWLARYSFE